ncbi:stage II sporulation protein P [Cohnella panacarvi]|uniref:stage II sporulation protein P n=1 Tax=Cohnella panacarvi TaxID=400776 RepID=UPI00047EB932|nr:stage II sporulation protein P [Cohnella panacarvi]
MKRVVVEMNWAHLRARWRRVLITGKAFIVLSLCSMILFILLGLGGMLQKHISASPVQSMQGLAASLPRQVFQSLLSMELPNMEADDDGSPLQADKLAAFLLRFVTGIDPGDPQSLIAQEMPGMDRDHSVLLRPGAGEPEAPEDHSPIEGTGTQPSEELQTEPTASVEPEPSQPSATPEELSPGDETDEQTTNGRKVVFIYHSHNRESYYPELKSGTKDPNSGTVNVTLVGKRLARQLEKEGVGSTHSNKDYSSSVKGYNWNYSYKYSLQTVKQALARNDKLTFFFDLHRDSQRRSKTTATIKGKDYAQVYFIIGHRNPNWRENEAFANKLHEKLEDKYPGLSRGVWGKTAANGNGEYNQSVAPESVLIEIGGVDNTLEECYRTADALAEVIAEQYWDEQDAVKANAAQ